MPISQPVAIGTSVTLFVIACIVGWWLIVRDDNLDHPAWVAIGIPTIAFLIAIGSLFWSLDDNYYDVNSGVVIAQSFTPAHYDYVLVGKVLTPMWRPDDWAIEVRDPGGQTGWLHFDQDPTAYYSVGSNYPR